MFVLAGCIRPRCLTRLPCTPTQCSSGPARIRGRVSFATSGLVVLVGVTHADTAAAAVALARKVFYLRVLRDEKSCADIAAPLLIVSQFTLYGETSKGRRPTWQAAAAGPVAEPLVAAFVAAASSTPITSVLV